MRKGIIFILAILYITVTSGVPVNLHYCMGSLASVDYGYDNHDQCGKCGMKESAKKKGCCHTESKLVKVQDAHQWVKTQVQLIEAPVILPSQPLIPGMTLSVQNKLYHSYANAPPGKAQRPLYPPNNVFRI